MGQPTILLHANTSWYLFNFRLPLAKALRQHGWSVMLAAPSDRFTRQLEEQGFRVITIDAPRRVANVRGEIKYLITLYRAVRNERPDVIFNFTIKSVIYGSIVARLTRQHRRINAIAGLGSVLGSSARSFSPLRQLITLLLRLALSGVQSRLIVQNPQDAEILLQRRLVSPEQLTLIRGSGVDAQHFQPRKPGSRSTHRVKRVLFASRLLRSKGIYSFIDAAKHLQTDRRFEFLCAGEIDEGNPDSLSRAELDQAQTAGVVRFLGHADNMQDLLASVDLIILPSTYGEGVPRILVEGAACGLPLIAFDVPGSREVVVHRVNGYLIQPHDNIALAQAVQDIFKSEDRYQQFSEASREIFLNGFTQEEVLRQTMDVINTTFS